MDCLHRPLLVLPLQRGFQLSSHQHCYRQTDCRSVRQVSVQASRVVHPQDALVMVVALRVVLLPLLGLPLLSLVVMKVVLKEALMVIFLVDH
jgi:hypothetical protein